MKKKEIIQEIKEEIQRMEASLSEIKNLLSKLDNEEEVIAMTPPSDPPPPPGHGG